MPEAEEPRVTTLELAPDWGLASPRDAEAFARDPLLESVWGNPVIFDRDTFFWNERRVHAAEMPGANGIGTMRSIARIYGSLVAGGGPLLTEETLRLGLTPLSTGYDALNDLTRSFGVGFQLPSESNYFGPAAEGFGHGGAGGSHHGAWPSLGIGYSYAMNQMRDGARPDPRAKALLDALHACAMDAGGS